MAYLDASCIASWHAHVYFDAASRDAAAKLHAVVYPLDSDAADGILAPRRTAAAP